jgi:hypothetical protein
MPYFSDLILEPSAEPAKPQPGQLWIPNAGPSAGELHVWSPKRRAWLNLYDNSMVAQANMPRWRKVLRALRIVR